MIPDSIPFALLFIFWMAGFISWGKHRNDAKDASRD